MKNRFLKGFLIGTAAMVLLWQSLQFSSVQKICIEFFINTFSPYSVSFIDIQASKRFPFYIDIRSITLKKNYTPVLKAKNVVLEFSDFFKKGISLHIENCEVISEPEPINFDFSGFSPSSIGYVLQNLVKKLMYFSSIHIDQLRIDNKEIALYLKRQEMSWNAEIIHKGECLNLSLTREGDNSKLYLGGFWEGQKVFANAKIKKDVVDVALKINIRLIANESLVDVFGDELDVSLCLEKFTYWRVKFLKIETSKGHCLQGKCLQRSGILEGDFIWNMPLAGSARGKCAIFVEGYIDRPVIRWSFEEGIKPLEKIAGECTLINGNRINLSALIQRDEKNTASAKMDISLSPFLINGNISIISPDLQKLLHLFLPHAKGSLNLNANLEDVSSLERGHVDIEGDGIVSDSMLHLPIKIKTTLHNGLGRGYLYLTKGRYKKDLINAHLAFNRTSEQVSVENFELKINDMYLLLKKPAVYNFTQGLPKAQAGFCGGDIDIEQLKIGDRLDNTAGSIKIQNVQLHKLRVLFEEYDISGILNGQLEKQEKKPLSAKFSISRGLLKQLQNRHKYEILNDLNAKIEAVCDGDIWRWNAKVKDQGKVNIETKGELDTNSLVIDAYLKGLVRLKLLTDWLATDDRIFGNVSINLRALGKLPSPTLEGEVNVDDGLYEHSGVGTLYQNIIIRMKAKEKRLVITRFDAQDVTKSDEHGVGQLRGEGWIDFSEPLSPVFNIPLHLYHLRIAQSDSFRSDASGTLIIKGKGDEVGCKGEVALENAYYYLETSAEAKVPQIVNKEEKIARKMKKKEYSTAFPLDILIHAPPGAFKVTGLGADTVWNGDFYVRKSIVNPFLVGNVYLYKGTLDVLGKVMHVTNGEITFVDTDRNNPRINIKAIKKLEDGIIVAIEIKGTGKDTIIDFSSMPSMAKEEVLALLLFGKKLGEVSVLQSIQLADIANSESDGQGFFEKMRSSFGFDQFEFKTSTLGGASATDEDATPQERAEVRTTQTVRIGKEFGKIQVAIEQGSGSETSKLTVSTPLGKSLALQGDIGAAQNSGVGVSWVKRY